MTDTNQAAALAALIDGMVECRRCGTPTAPHPTNEPVCGPCWRHIPLWEERVAQQAGHAGNHQARRHALERTDNERETSAAGAGVSG